MNPDRDFLLIGGVLDLHCEAAGDRKSTDEVVEWLERIRTDIEAHPDNTQVTQVDKTPTSFHPGNPTHVARI